jgi:predicted RNase H-like HicB family nuclease
VELNEGRIAFTAVYLKGEHGYVGFIEEIPGILSQAPTLEEARDALVKLASIAFDEERRNAQELTAGQDVLREPFYISISLRSSKKRV